MALFPPVSPKVVLMVLRTLARMLVMGSFRWLKKVRNPLPRKFKQIRVEYPLCMRLLTLAQLPFPLPLLRTSMAPLATSRRVH